MLVTFQVCRCPLVVKWRQVTVQLRKDTAWVRVKSRMQRRWCQNSGEWASVVGAGRPLNLWYIVGSKHHLSLINPIRFRKHNALKCLVNFDLHMSRVSCKFLIWCWWFLVSMFTGQDWRSCRAQRRKTAMKMTKTTSPLSAVFQLISWQQKESQSAGRKMVADVQIFWFY